MEDFKVYSQSHRIFDIFNQFDNQDITTYFNSFKNNNPITIIDVGGKEGKEKELNVIPGVKFNYKIMEYDKKYSVGENRVFGDITNCPQIDDNSYDFVMSINTLEHVTEPWTAADNMVRILKPNSLIFIIAPFSWRYHEHPIDYWRFSPRGLEYLFNRTNKVKTLHVGYYADKEKLSLYLGIKNEL